MTQSIVHISPLLPPQNSGVGDYATLVGQRMEEIGGGVVCGYIAAGCNREELPPDGERVRNITGACDGRSLWRAVEELASPQSPSPIPLSIVLHYSGYGFDRNGCPAWLVDALRNRPKFVARVLTYFHELYATSPPWRRAFWYSGRQQRVAAEVARLSDAVLTNRAASARWLETQRKQPVGAVSSLPVCSNVGELSEPRSLAEREPIAVCFGAKQFKESFLRKHAPETADVCAALGIQRLVNISQPVAIATESFNEKDIQVDQPGALPAVEVSGVLSRARLAYIDYYPDYLAKSGSLAAFASHGVPAVMGDACNRSADGLVAGEQYLCLREALRLAGNPDSLVERLDQVGSALFAWYQAHNIVSHARSLLCQTVGNNPATSELAVTC